MVSPRGNLLIVPQCGKYSLHSRFQTQGFVLVFVFEIDYYYVALAGLELSI